MTPAKPAHSTEPSRLYVLDTNVLMHDPTAIFRFQEHDIFLPMVVLEELDAAKKGHSDISRNVRQVGRFFNELLAEYSDTPIEEGIPIPGTIISDGDIPAPAGRLFFQTRDQSVDMPEAMPGSLPDNQILRAALSFHQDKRQVTLVSKDINLRIKARVLGIHAEDYRNDQVLDDVRLMYRGTEQLPDDFWERHGEHMKAWHDAGHSYYDIESPLVEDWSPNQCLYLGGDRPFEGLVREKTASQRCIIEYVTDYRDHKTSVWGINARNQEQNFALNLLMDPDIDFVSISGQAGSGKTLLALAAGLEQVIEDKQYREIILTREVISVGEEIGFLPGTEEEKMTPWMGALIDNLEVLTRTEDPGSKASGAWGQAATNDLLGKRIKIRSLSFMRGRTFNNRFIIIDEAQNLTPKQMKTLITRAGPDSKIVCLGNLAQIDSAYLSETTSGLTYVVDRFKAWQHSGHITLVKGERSRLSDYASENL